MVIARQELGKTGPRAEEKQGRGKKEEQDRGKTGPRIREP